MDYWEKDFSDLPFYTIIEKLFELPDDLAGSIIRSVIKDERQANAFIILADRFEKYHDERHMKMLRYKLATMAAMGGRARIEALFGAIRLLAPDMYRAAIGMPRSKNGLEKREEVMRGAPDYREVRQEED